MTTAQTYRRSARWIGFPLAGMTVAALAACGSGSTTTSGGTSTAAPTTADDAYGTCLAANGVTLPDPRDGQGGPPTDARPTGEPPTGAPSPMGNGGSTPPGVDESTWAAARQACASVAPTPPGTTAAAGTG